MTIKAARITPDAFAPFGEVIEAKGAHIMINDGNCARYTDLAKIDIVDGAAGISFFQAVLRSLPYSCDLLERHPLGSQCFIPMQDSSYLVIVAEDADGTPINPQAFTVSADTAVNIARNTWHGVLTPLSGTGLFAVIDRIAAEGSTASNLEEVRLEKPLLIEAAL